MTRYELNALKQWRKLRDIAVKENSQLIHPHRKPNNHIRYTISEHEKWQLDQFLKMFGE